MLALSNSIDALSGLAGTARPAGLAAAALGHDLREPIRKILRHAHAVELSEGSSLSPEGQRELRSVMVTARRMQDLVRDLLLLAGEGAASLRMRPVPLGGVLASALDDLALMIEETGATIDVRKLPVVFGEPGLLRVVARNLLHNALKFAEPGRPPEIAVRVARGNSAEIGFVVEDRGPGISAPALASLERLFDGGSSSAGEACGIGLHLCDLVARRHGGRMTVRRRRGGGASFGLLLPRIAQFVGNDDVNADGAGSSTRKAPPASTSSTA